MFDKYLVREGGGHMTASVNVNEQRATTDQSVQLLKEMELAAEKKVTDVIIVDGNDLKGKILVLENDPFTRQSVVCFVFELNGKEYNFTENIKIGWKVDPDVLIRKLYESVAKVISELLILQLDKTEINDYIKWYKR